MNSLWSRYLSLEGSEGGFRARQAFWAQAWPGWVTLLVVLS